MRLTLPTHEVTSTPFILSNLVYLLFEWQKGLDLNLWSFSTPDLFACGSLFIFVKKGNTLHPEFSLEGGNQVPLPPVPGYRIVHY